MRSGDEQTEKSAHGRKRHNGENQEDPLPRTKRRIEDERHQQQGYWHDERQPPVGALLALVLAGPVQVIALGKRDLVSDLVNRLADGAAQVAAAHAVLDGNVAGVSLAVDCGSTVVKRPEYRPART